MGVYVPNAGQNLKRLDYRTLEWDKDFSQYLEGLKEKKAVVLAGDLNITHKPIDLWDTKGKHKCPGYSPEERANFSKFLNLGWIDTFRYLYPSKQEFSFWSMRFNNQRPQNKGLRADYFVVSKNFINYCQDSLINTEYFGSDHCPI